MDVRFGILGPIEVSGEGGHTVRVPRGRALSLLALLLIHRGAPVHLDRVVDELWEGAGPQNARNAVQVVVSRLRTALGEDRVVSRGGGYALRLLPGELDAARFEARLRVGREELARADPWEAAATLGGALELWRGPALADVAGARFAQPEVARLEELRLSCLGARIEADLACGRHAELVGELDGLVRAHPLREELRRQLMLALYRTGRQADALAAYRDAHRTLVDGLGIEPSSELRELESAILSQEVPDPAPPAERGTTAASAAPEARRWVTCVFSQLTGLDVPGGLDPESLRAVAERFHVAASTVYAGHGGSVVELRNDAVLAVLGLPSLHEDDALRALRAASELAAQELPFAADVRSGVCTGEVVVRAGPPRAGSVVGGAVVAAERLARAASSGEIRLAAATWTVVRHAVDASRLHDGSALLGAIDADAPAIARRLDQPLLGRAEEVGVLRDTFARVAGGRVPELLTVIGEPGIGKSRLVAELETIVRARGTVLTGRCQAYGDGTTWWPLREVVRQAQAGRSVGELAGALGIPSVAVRRIAAAVGLEDGDPGEDTDWAFLRLFRALARLGPIAIVVDDAHWAEPALLDLLLDLVDRLGDAPVLVVWVARPDLLDRSEGRVARGGRIVLPPLSDASSTSLLAAITGGRLPLQDVERIAEAAGGNPLFLEQLVAYVDERQAADALPPALQALLAARLDRLDAAERSALALGAIVGERFTAGAVHALADGVTDAETQRACDQLVGRDLLIRDTSGPDPPSLRFRHALIRDVAYSSLAKSARARLHERHAAWLTEQQQSNADARIGFHLERACRFAEEVNGRVPPDLARRAARRLAAAATAANDRGDLAGEIGLLDRAVTLFGTADREGVELLPSLVSSLFETGASDRAEALADLAVSVSDRPGLERVHARVEVEREHIRLSRHPDTFQPERSSAVAVRAGWTLQAAGDELGLARTAYLQSDLRWLAGDPLESYAHAVQMLAFARQAGSEFDAATALVFMSWCYVLGPWPVPEAIARCDALIRDAEPTGKLSILGGRAVLMAMLGRYDEARADLARARAGFADLRLDTMIAYLALAVAQAETLMGDAVAAEQAVRYAGTMGGGDRWHESMVTVDLAQTIIAQGPDADADAAVARIDATPAPCDLEWRTKRHVARAGLAMQAGDHARGIAEARAAVTEAEPSGLLPLRADTYRTLAEVLLASGQRDPAAAAARRALTLDEEKGNLVAAAATRELLASLTV